MGSWSDRAKRRPAQHKLTLADLHLVGKVGVPTGKLRELDRRFEIERPAVQRVWQPGFQVPRQCINIKLLAQPDP